MKARHVPFVVVTPIAAMAALSLACGSDAPNAPAPDSGVLETGPVDAGVPTPDAENVDAAIAVGPCAAAQRIDTAGGIVGGLPAVVAEAYEDKYVAMWAAVDANDKQTHVKARAFDGTTFGSEEDLGVATTPSLHMGQDAAGHAFAGWVGFGGSRRVFAFADMSFGPVATFEGTNLALAAGGPGSGLSLYEDNDKLHLDRWKDGSWNPVGSVDLPTTSSVGVRMLATPSGKAVATWYDWNPKGEVRAVAFDGGALGAPVSPSIDGGTADAYPAHAVLSNGDALFMLRFSDSVQTTLFHADTGVFDPPVLVHQAKSLKIPVGFNVVVADSKDRLTITWSGPDAGGGEQRSFTSRSFDRGAHWSSPADLGASKGSMLGVDPKDNVVVAVDRGTVSPTDKGILIRAAGPTDTSWSPTVATNLTANAYSLSDGARMVFDTKGHVIVIGVMEVVSDAGGPGLGAVTCTVQAP